VCVPLFGAEAKALRGTSALIVCEIQTVEHLSCPGGLPLANAPPPDCRNFVSEHVVASRSQKFVIPRAYLRAHGGELQLPKNSTALDFQNGISYRSLVPDSYTDAAGYSVDSGTCSVISARTGRRRRL
jgi:hypothetical protein